MDPSYYLLDSLDASVFSERDSILVNDGLIKYHSAAHDSSKLLALEGLVEDCNNDELWPKYNQWILDYTQNKLSNNDKHGLIKMYKEFLASALNNKGYYHDNRGQPLKALVNYQKSLELEIELGNEPDKAAIYNNMGFIYENQGNFPLALDYFQKCLKIEEQFSDSLGIAKSFVNIGSLHHKQNEINLCLKYFNKSLTIYHSANDLAGVALMYNNMGVVYKGMDSLTLALNCFKKSLEIRKEIEDRKGVAIVYNNIAFIYTKNEQVDSALMFYQLSLDIKEEIGDLEGMAIAYYNISHIYMDKGDFNAAEKLAEKGLKMAKKVGYPDVIVTNAGILSVLAIKNQNWEKALEMRNLQIRMRDSLKNEESFKSTAKLEAKYAFEKREAVLETRHHNELELEKANKEKQRILIIFTAGGLCMAIFFLFFIVNRLKISRNQRKEIELRKQEIESAHIQLSESHQEIKDSITYAKSIQDAIMPTIENMLYAFEDGFLFYQPKDVVAGDFFWMETVVNECESTVYFAVADCTGHGVPGAMVSVICSNALTKTLMEEGVYETGNLLGRTRELVIERLAKSGKQVRDGMDISLCAYNKHKKSLQWSGANNPIWIKKANTSFVEELKGDRQPIGLYGEKKPFNSHEIRVNVDDAIYMFSDGLQDQFGGEKGKKLKSKRLMEILNNNSQKPMCEQMQILKDMLENWQGKYEQVDDICFLGIRF